MSKKVDHRFDNYWAKLLGQAKVALMGASDIQLKIQLFDVLQDFFDRSNCWKETVGFTVIPKNQDYPLKVVDGRILRLLAVLDQNNMVQQTVMPDIGTVHFIYPYDQTQPMNAILIKTVTNPLECYPPNIPDWIISKHGLVLLQGLLGHMMLIPAQSYSNPQMANIHLQAYENGIYGALVASTKMNTIGAQTWMFPQQFRSSSQRGGISTYNVHPTPR